MAVNKGYEFEDENRFSEKNFSHSDSQLSSIEHKTQEPTGDRLQTRGAKGETSTVKEVT